MHIYTNVMNKNINKTVRQRAIILTNQSIRFDVVVNLQVFRHDKNIQ